MNFLAATLLVVLMGLPVAFAADDVLCEANLGLCYALCTEQTINGKKVWVIYKPQEPLDVVCIRDKVEVKRKKVTFEECAELAGARCWKNGANVVHIPNTRRLLVPDDPGTPPQCITHCEGDPHMKTWGGEAYDYHGECDLVMMHAPALDLRVHIRTTIRYDYSYISSAVLQLGEDTVEVSGWGSVVLNGVSIPPEELFELTNTDQVSFIVNYTNPGDLKTHIFEIYVSSQAERVVMKTFKDWVSVMVERGLQKHFADSSGLLGSFTTGAKLARDGETVLDDPIAFGNEWQVLDSEPMLFQSVRSPQYPERCRLPTMTQDQRNRRLGATMARETAETACAHWNHKKDQCIFDVMASGDLEVATNEPF